MDKTKACNFNCRLFVFTSSNKVYGDYNWTNHIKRCLAELGSSNGFEICAATENKEYQNEWLYDLVWYKENSEGLLIDVPLVVESEWKRNEYEIVLVRVVTGSDRAADSVRER